MPPQLTALINKVDNVELLRDELGAILVLESAEQQVLATAASEDPNRWKLRVFVERSNPWSEFADPPDEVDSTPIVNVQLESVSYDGRASNAVERQKATAVYHIDCYGYGVSRDDGADGHEPGDAVAALEAQRALRLVRNILMAGAYTYLGQRGLVWKRWIQSVQMFQPQLDARTVPQVIAVRIALAVDFNEFSPQVEGEELELIAASVLRKETGELYLRADYPATP